ncbi:hypothetical protein FOA43_002128 [Brettanomyces nanus]|uniref:Carboxypeptidase n=1 Tax=Eeniella nana TaxID=13502 RepID=A0A875S6H9_EENNA|nr:uncharacterized protein FOA43_002128 [Brettanomyces nanus]QPG74794.1 hypothetical protein FOA43_002128 [Brettanomyces nanus]
MSLTLAGLLLFSLIAAVLGIPIDEGSQYLVKGLPGISNIPESLIPTMHAGQLDLSSENNTGLFFWRFSKEETAPTDSLVIWLNGGPGCSSMDGAMMEIGPFRPDSKDSSKLAYNNGTWLDSADLLFIDQPIGTGFAYTEVNFDTELTEASQHIVEFLKEYLRLFPGDATRKVWIAGESYAGQYIPYFADAILKEVKKDGGFKMNIQGLLIGNGWIEPDIQSLSYVPFAMQHNLIDSTNPLMARLLSQHERCQNAINDPQNDEFEKTQCDKVLDVFTRATRVAKNQQDRGTCYNVYDYRKQDSYPACGSNWPEILPSTQNYLNLEQVHKSLNLKHEKEWTECNNRVSSLFSPKKSAKAFDLLPNLLTEVPVMLFNGDKDIICNYMGTEMMIEKLDIGGGQMGFSNESETWDWTYSGNSVGSVRNEMNLTYVRVYNSSHMVPYDLPEVSLGLLDIMYQVVAGNSYHEGVIVTPVHGVDIENTAVESSATSHTLLEVGIVIFAIADIYFIYIYFAGQRPPKSSLIKSTGSKKTKKKRVHWSDGSEESTRSSEDFADKPDENRSMLSSILTRLGYGERRYEDLDGDIEMGDIEEMVSDEDVK